MKSGKLVVDYDLGEISCNGASYDLKSSDAFELISDAYLKIGWQNKHVYSFTWFGRPIIQFPEDLIRVQELIYDIKPDFIIETGIAHGGSLIYYASLCKALGKGRVIGVDIDIRKNNRDAMEKHELYDYITMYEGSSVDESIIKEMEEQIKSSGIESPKILVLLDACHTKAHTLKELELYSRFVSIGSYIIATDGGVMQRVSDLKNAIKADPDWATNNPKVAAEEFVSSNKNFAIVEPKFKFNEGTVSKWFSYWQGGIIE